MSGADRAHWARVARDWIAWARAPGHDAFWYYRAGLAALIGPGGGEALDVGCGEGRVSRLLGELGCRVTACRRRGRDGRRRREAAGSAADYAVAPAAALPFADAALRPRRRLQRADGRRGRGRRRSPSCAG